MRIPPLLWGGALGLLAAAALAPAVGEAIARLAVARGERAALRAALDGPATPSGPVADALTMTAANRDAAGRAMVARVRQLAGRGGVLVEEVAPAADPAGLARIRLRVSGSEDAVIALADAIERTPPLARFAAWRIEASSGAVRLQGELVAPWR